jgi:serine/threonine protein kinase
VLEEMETVHLSPGAYLHERYRIQSVISVSKLSVVYQVLEAGEDSTETPSSPLIRIIKEFYPRALSMRDLDGKTVLCRLPSTINKFNALLEAFLQEASIMGMLDHPHISRYMEHFQENGTAYIVMAYYPGITLDTYVREKLPASKEAMAGFYRKTLLPLLDSILYIHEKGILHRDLKPGNVIIAEDGSPTLLDFGAAIYVGTKSCRPVFTSAGYSPLEFYSDKARQSARSDLFSLAAILYYCCSGQQPADVKERIIQDHLIPLRQNTKQVSPLLSGLVMWGLAVSQDRRCPSVRWLRAALRMEEMLKRLMPSASRA